MWEEKIQEEEGFSNRQIPSTLDSPLTFTNCSGKIQAFPSHLIVFLTSFPSLSMSGVFIPNLVVRWSTLKLTGNRLITAPCA
jgi:hypothetical protein